MKKIALVGTGPLGLGFITQMAASLEQKTKFDIASIDIFDSYGKYGLGAGLPYDLETTDPEHLLNIKSANNNDSFGKSLDWFKNNEAVLKTKFYEMYSQRLAEKLEQTSSTEHENLYNHYEKIWQSIEKRYLNFDIAETYHPRILLGIRNIVIFEEALQKIRDHGINVVEHRQTEITALEKITDGQIALGFKDQTTNFSDVILTTGRWRLQDSEHKPRQIPEIWPISEFKSELNKILHEEIKLRQEAGDENKEIKIAIQGQSLTAIDALKTIFNDGLFEEENGKWKFTAQSFEGYAIKVDLLARTSNLMQSVKGKDGWEKQEKFSKSDLQGTEIDQEIIGKLAQSQDGKIRLWQWMLINARSIENGYRIAGQENSANQAREFVKLIISNVSTSPLQTDCDQILDKITGGTLEQIQKIQHDFSLPLDGVNYQPIVAAFREKFLNKPPIEQLRENLAMAESGDTKDGYLLWKAIYGQNDNVILTTVLHPEESAFHLQFILRIRDAFHNGMPIQTAKEILAMHEAGIVDYRTIDRVNCEPTFDSKKNKVAINMADQTIEYYDAIASARGYSIDFRKNISPLAQSLAKYFSFIEETWNPDVTDLEARFGKNETQEMLKLNRDGHFCTGDYRRNVIFNHEGKAIARQPIDENNNPVLPEVMIPISSSTAGAIENGKRAFLYKFAKPTPETTIVVNNQPQALKTDVHINSMN